MHAAKFSCAPLSPRELFKYPVLPFRGCEHFYQNRRLLFSPSELNFLPDINKAWDRISGRTDPSDNEKER